MNAYAKSADAYLTQRILGASPEQAAGIIMEAGQLHLGKAIRALTQKDLAAATDSFIRVSEVILEATALLNLADGGEVAQNLGKLYDWWSREIMAASFVRDTARLAAVAHGMGEIRQAWEQLHEQKTGLSRPSQFEFGNQVV